MAGRSVCCSAEFRAIDGPWRRHRDDCRNRIWKLDWTHSLTVGAAGYGILTRPRRPALSLDGVGLSWRSAIDRRAGKVAGVTGLEPAASGVTGQRSNQLSYTPVRREPAF